MIPCGDKADVGERGDGTSMGCPFREDTGRQEEVAGRVEEVSYVTICDGA